MTERCICCNSTKQCSSRLLLLYCSRWKEPDQTIRVGFYDIAEARLLRHQQVGQSELQHPETMLGRGESTVPFVGRSARDEKGDQRNSEGLAGCLGDGEVTVVNRVEYAAEESDRRGVGPPPPLAHPRLQITFGAAKLRALFLESSVFHGQEDRRGSP